MIDVQVIRILAPVSIVDGGGRRVPYERVTEGAGIAHHVIEGDRKGPCNAVAALHAVVQPAPGCRGIVIRWASKIIRRKRGLPQSRLTVVGAPRDGERFRTHHVVAVVYVRPVDVYKIAVLGGGGSSDGRPPGILDARQVVVAHVPRLVHEPNGDESNGMGFLNSIMISGIGIEGLHGICVNHTYIEPCSELHLSVLCFPLQKARTDVELRSGMMGIIEGIASRVEMNVIHIRLLGHVNGTVGERRVAYGIVRHLHLAGVVAHGVHSADVERVITVGIDAEVIVLRITSRRLTPSDTDAITGNTRASRVVRSVPDEVYHPVVVVIRIRYYGIPTGIAVVRELKIGRDRRRHRVPL